MLAHRVLSPLGGTLGGIKSAHMLGITWFTSQETGSGLLGSPATSWSHRLAKQSERPPTAMGSMETACPSFAPQILLPVAQTPSQKPREGKCQPFYLQPGRGLGRKRSQNFDFILTRLATAGFVALLTAVSTSPSAQQQIGDSRKKTLRPLGEVGRGGGQRGRREGGEEEEERRPNYKQPVPEGERPSGGLSPLRTGGTNCFPQTVFHSYAPTAGTKEANTTAPGPF